LQKYRKCEKNVAELEKLWEAGNRNAIEKELSVPQPPQPRLNAKRPIEREGLKRGADRDIYVRLGTRKRRTQKWKTSKTIE